MSAGCRRFKQNAWKKEMCTNCYRPKDEHQQQTNHHIHTLPVYPRLPNIPPSQSILKCGGGGRRRKAVGGVRFPEEESEVIGYGGEAATTDSDDSEDELGVGLNGEGLNGATSSGAEESSEEQEQLLLITKSNTRFNSLLANLTSATASTPLQLYPLQPLQPDSNRVEVVEKKVKEEIKETKEEEESPAKESKKEERVNVEVGGTEKEAVRKEGRSAPEGRKSGIVRGQVITKKCGGVRRRGTRVVEVPPVPSRESAGEPDGKADSDEAEQPFSPRPSFLHSPTNTNINGSVKGDGEVKKICGEEKEAVRKRPAPQPPCATAVPQPPLSQPPCATVVVPQPPFSQPLCVVGMPLIQPTCTAVTGQVPSPSSTPIPSPVLSQPPPVAPPLPLSQPPSVTGAPPLPLSEPPYVTVAPQLVMLQPPCAVAVVPPPLPLSPPPSPEAESPSTSPLPPHPPTEPPRRRLTLDGSKKRLEERRNVRSEEIEIEVRLESEVEPRAKSDDEGKVAEEKVIEEAPDGSSPTAEKKCAPSVPPPPSPRRASEGIKRSTSEDGVGKTGGGETKTRTKVKDSLRKLLRLRGLREDVGNTGAPAVPPVIRARPHIIHPIDLNTTAITVLHSSQAEKSSDSTQGANTTRPTSSVPGVMKPPPPPRSESLNLMERLKVAPNMDNIYANLGEGRSGLAPVKPERSGSLREGKPRTGAQSEHSLDQHHPPQVREAKVRAKKKARSGLVQSSLDESYEAVLAANQDALSLLLKQLVCGRGEDEEGREEEKGWDWSEVEMGQDGKAAEVGGGLWLVEGAARGAEGLLLLVVPSSSALPSALHPSLKFRAKFTNVILPSQHILPKLPSDGCNVGVFEKGVKVNTLEDWGRGERGELEKGAVLLQAAEEGLRGGGACLVFSTQSDPGPCLAVVGGGQGGEGWLRGVAATLGAEHLLEGVALSGPTESIKEAVGARLWGPPSSAPSPPLAWLALQTALALASQLAPPHPRLTALHRLRLEFLIKATPHLVSSPPPL